MINLRRYRHRLFLLALAMVGGGGRLCAQENLPPADAEPVIVDGKQAAKMVLTRSAPEYPPVAKVNYLQGQVQLELTVNGNGEVADAHVLEGNAILAASALKAVRRWIYHPLGTASRPLGFITTVKMKFSLHYHEPDLAPRQAEQDFLRQVKPPQLIRPPQDAHPGEVAHLRVLVDDAGQVVDMEASPAGRGQFEAAREILRGWTFRPAHWGNLPIASYLKVDVPLRTRPAVRAAVESARR